MIKAVVITISDTRVKENDESGKRLRVLLKQKGFNVCGYEIVQDNKEQIKKELIIFADDKKTELVITTGGTGFGPRDVTPEATFEVIEKQAQGISELIRLDGLKKTKKAALSRGISGIRNNTLIINLPGSPKGAVDSLESIFDIIPHAIDMINGKGH